VSRDQRRRGGPALGDAAVVENGVPRERGKRSSRDDFVLCLGRVCPEKGFHLALDAARAAGLPLVLAGQVFPYAEHERYFEREILPRLDGRRCFVGPVEGAAKRRLLATARCVAVPSLVHETSSLVAMEALAAGTPVVARRAGALPEIVEDGETGLFAETADDFAAAFHSVRALRASRCRAAARTRFDSARMVTEYVDLYARLATAC